MWFTNGSIYRSKTVKGYRLELVLGFIANYLFNCVGFDIYCYNYLSKITFKVKESEANNDR